MFYQDWEHYYPGWENWYTNPGHHHHSQAYSHHHHHGHHGYPSQFVRQSHHHRPRRKYGPYYVPTSIDQYAFPNASSNATGHSDYFYGAAYHHHANSNLG